MLTFKVFGGLCIFLSAMIFYIDIQNTQKSKIKAIESYILLMEYIENQIESYMKPIDSILNDCDKAILENCGANLSKSNLTLHDLTQNSNLCLNEEISSYLNTFANEFGTKYRIEQISSCEKCIQLLNNHLNKIKEKHQKDKKVKLALCLSISFSIILLLS